MKNSIFKTLIFSFIIGIYLSFTNIGITTVYAEDYLVNDEVDSQLDELYNYINNMKTNEELINDLDPYSYVKSYIETGEGNLTLSKISGAVISLIFKEVKVVLALAFSIIVIGIICSLLKNLQSAFSSDSISEIAFYACYALLIVLISKTFLISLDLAKDVIIDITNLMAKVLPILVLMLVAAGGFSQAATMDPIVLGATIIVPKIYLNIIIPLILMTFVVTFTNNITSESKLSTLASAMKKITLWAQGIVLTIFIGILTIRGITASTIDAVTLKTTKYAVDSFIPIVGKSFSDAISSVAGYSLIIKNAIGSVGLVVIILLILAPIVKIVLSSMIFKLSAILLEPITDKRITSSVSAAGEALTLIMTSVLSISIMFFILIAVMINAGKIVIGG